jgi:ADP-heptose:LPS heptosyltransferase
MKIVIRLPNWLGDLVMATAFVEATRQLYPDDVIDVIIKKELSSIAPMIEGINKIHIFSKQEYPGLGGVLRFGKTLRDEQYDIFFNLPASISSAVMAWGTRAKKRVGFTQEGGIFLLTNAYKKPTDVHHVDKYLTILEQFTGKAVTDKHVWLNAEKPADEPHRVLVNFNSEASSRRMPLDKGKHMINTLTANFPKTTFTFIGSPKEKEYVVQLLDGLDNADRLENITGTTNLPQLSTIMACSNVILTTDSGPAHLANGVGAPSIVLTGAGNEHYTAPYNTKDMYIVRYGKLECEPCGRNVCKLYGVPKCMLGLDEAEIINIMSKYINHAN